MDTIKQLGSSINEENMNSVLKRMDDIANVKMGKETYGEMNKKTAGMTAYDKISYFNDVMSSPEFKAHTEELMKTAQEQKAKAGGKRSVEGEDGNTANKENIKQEAVNSDNAKVKADNASVKNEGNTNNNINGADNSVQDKTTPVNENVTIDKVNDSNADINNNDEDKANVNIELNVDKQDVFNNGDEALLNEGSNGIDTDNGPKVNNQSDKNPNEMDTINQDSNSDNYSNGSDSINDSNSDDPEYKLLNKDKTNSIIKNDIITGAKKTTGWQNRHADLMYAEISKRTTDAKHIANNTSFTEKDVIKIKDHMFNNEHKLNDGTVKKFDPDFDQAQAWDRLTQGKHTDLDILLLEHEYLELTLMNKFDYTYEVAHELANKKYNWFKAFKEAKKHEK